MRILFLNDRIPPENRGGAGVVVWRLATALRDAGHEIHIIAATEKEPFREVREGIPTYHLKVNYPPRWRAWFSLYNPQVNKALKELYQEIQPDIINAHNIHEYLTYHSITMAHKMGFPTVFTSHDVMPFAYQKLSPFAERRHCENRSTEDYRLPPFFNLKQMRFRYNPFRNRAIRHILTKHTQARIAPSHELCKAHQANGLPEFSCVHNAVDVEKFRASLETIEALRQRLGLKGYKVILFAGRLTGAKGTKALLDALERIVQDIPKTRLLVLSSVPLNEQLQKHKFQSAEKYIKLGGWLSGEELAAAFHLADVVTMPSLVFESFGMVAIEGMAASKPVIASCYGGTNEIVEDGKTGYLINPFDNQMFVDRLRTLLSDNTLSRNMGQAGYQRVISQFSTQKQVDNTLKIFKVAIASKDK